MEKCSLLNDKGECKALNDTVCANCHFYITKKEVFEKQKKVNDYILSRGLKVAEIDKEDGKHIGLVPIDSKL